MECKKCANLNFLISQEKHSEAVDLANEYLVMFKKETIVPLEHSKFNYLCKSCFNLYESELKSVEFDHEFKFDKFITHDGKLLKNIAYSFTLFNLMSAYKNYHSSFDSVDLYFHADRFYPIPFSLTGSDILGENFTSVDIIKKLGVNAPEHSFSPKMFPSFDDLLRDLPKDGAIIQNSIFFKVSIDKESISYDVDFTKFPITDILFTTNTFIKPQNIQVLDDKGNVLGNTQDLDFDLLFSERSLSYGNYLTIVSGEKKKNYQGEPFVYNSDIKPYLDELVFKYLR